MLDQVTSALAAIETAGSFATELVCSARDLHIEVNGLGPLRFPISSATAKRVCALARPAPFGRRDKTLHDARVRDTWEIDARALRLDTRAWTRTLEPHLAEVRTRLGLPERGALKIVLDKMLVYGPGQFFASHQDSERDDDMVGSLVVELPSAHEGGALVVTHHDKTKTLGKAARGRTDVRLLAFYADCRHEVKPVRSGYRITLTFHLLHRGIAGDRACPPAPAVERLATSVRAYFATPIAERYSTAPPQKPDRLIYLLDHEYSEKSLAWHRLKSADRPHAAALEQVAERLDCELFLALADVHESWSCDGDDEWDGGYGRRRSRRGMRYVEDDDEDGEGGEGDQREHTLVDLIDSGIELRHWIGADGRPVSGVSTHPPGSEICWTKASVDMSPFRSEHEGYMGNYGNTVDRWYHRAAVVMWPRERSFVIRAKVSPAWAVKELAARVRRGAVEEARTKAKDLLPFWKHVAPREAGDVFARELFTLAATMDQETAFGLVSPLGPHRLSARATPAFVALVLRHGLVWARRLCSGWPEPMRYNAEPSWRASLPRLCAALAGGGSMGEELAPWLLAREVAAFKEEHRQMFRLPEADWEKDAERRMSDLVALFHGAAAIGAAEIRDDLVAFLTAPATALPRITAGGLFKKLRGKRGLAATRGLGLGALYRHMVRSLEDALAVPERSPDDWAIDPPGGCKCDLCPTLSAFLRDPRKTALAWPLAENRRAHVHGILDRHRLPVAHVTRREGRPYTLVLTKQTALFEREKALRSRQRELLAWLRTQKEAFVPDRAPAERALSP